MARGKRLTQYRNRIRGHAIAIDCDCLLKIRKCKPLKIFRFSLRPIKRPAKMLLDKMATTTQHCYDFPLLTAHCKIRTERVDIAFI